MIHVSTQESHHLADYLRTVNRLYPLQYYICIFALVIPYALHCMSRKLGLIIYLGKCILCAAVGVVVAAVVRPIRTSQRGGGFFFSVYSSAFLLVLGLLNIGAVLCYFLSVISNQVILYHC